MSESLSTSPSAKSMRLKAAKLREEGRTRNTFWFSREAIDVLDQVRETKGFSSREAAINAILERIGDDMFLKQEFLAVTK